MRRSLQRLDSPRSAIDRVVYALDFGEDPALFEHERARFETLDEAQRSIVRCFLELASTRGDVCDAEVARHYWLAEAPVV